VSVTRLEDETWVGASRLLRAVVWVSSVGLGACASQVRDGGASVAQLPGSPELSQAYALAPDYVTRSLAAERAAQQAQTLDERQDEAERAQLWAWAAEAEAQRIELSRELTVYERRIEQAQLRRVQAERAARERQAERDRQLAAQTQQVEAEHAFALLARRDVEGLTSKERDRVWSFLVDRARGVTSLARALGAGSAELEHAALQLTAAERTAKPTRVAQARAALASAYAALGRARASRAQISAAEREELRESLRERGFVLSSAGDGSPTTLVVPTEHADVRHRFAVLAELLPAFPHGPIVLSCGEAAASGPTACPQVSALSVSERARVQVVPRPSEMPSRALQVVLPAYRDVTP